MTISPKLSSSLTLGFLATSLLLTTAPAMASGAPKPGVIAVSATGTANIEPDMAVLSLAVSREGKTAREALTKNNSAMAGVLNALKARGIEDRDLQTSNFNIQPRYFYPKPQNGTQKPPRVIGYVVSNNLTVRVRNLSSLGEVLDEAVTFGVNSGGGISFSSSDPSEAVETARKNAMKEALKKAGTLTDAAGVNLGRILEISEQGGRRPIRAKAMARSLQADVAESAVPIASGENTYSITVNVRWEIQQ